MKFFFDIYDKVMIAQLISVSISLVLVFRHLVWKPKQVIRCIYHAIIIFVMGTILNYGLFELSTQVAFLRGINFPLSWLVTIVIYLTFFSNIPVVSRFIMGVTLYISVVTMTELGHAAARMMGGMEKAALWESIVYILDIMLILGFAVMLKKLTLSKYRDIPPISALLTFANATVMAMLIFIYTKINLGNIEADMKFYCAVLIAEYLLVISGYLMIWFHCKVRYEKTQLEVENRLLESDKTMIKMTEQAVEEMRCLRHDIKNQYQIIRMLLEDGKYQELQEYFDSMNLERSIALGSKFIDCGNGLLNSIINMEIMKAASIGVQVTAKITVSEFITVEKSDLSRLLVNLIDNAIEACERYEAYDKSVDVKISKNKDYLYISVRNGLGNIEDKEKALKLKTTKTGPGHHGYGHRIVERIVNEYNGHIKYSIEEDEFVAEAMLGLEKAVND